MKIGIVREALESERRVAASPESVRKLVQLGYEVVVASGVGNKAGLHDEQFAAAGAEIVSDDEAWKSDIIVKINPPSDKEIQQVEANTTIISLLSPATNMPLLEATARRHINLIALDAVPRISRAQAMDVLSSMANIAGYRAVIEAAHAFGRFFAGQMTAAGKIPPAKVLVIGAGVAGLAAIGTAVNLGAIVRAFDARPEVKEQIQSMGAEFLEVEIQEDTSSESGYAKEMSDAFIEAEMALFRQQAEEVDIIITTAMIPSKPAPRLITKDMVAAMKPGSVIVDLAAASGGNCELTEAGKMIQVDGVTIIGYTDLPSRLPMQSSRLFANNVANLLGLLTPNKDGRIVLTQDDIIVQSVAVVRDGEVHWPPPKVSVSAAPPKAESHPEPQPHSDKAKHWPRRLMLFAGVLLYALIGFQAPPEFLQHFTVFALSVVVGYYVVWNVTHALHTPLMSVTNAISGIIVVGALLQISSDNVTVRILAAVAVLVACINIFGGFIVTERMLRMFRKGGDQ